jgi:hypothetical protein
MAVKLGANPEPTPRRARFPPSPPPPTVEAMNDGRVSATATGRFGMATDQLRTVDLNVDELMREIERYLAAVELFRQEGHEPVWSSENR